jgi:ParB-like chromosome segregation protein Spo0J
VPYAKNARTQSEEQVEQIARRDRAAGWTVPCLVDEKGGLIAGHGRVLAAKHLGLDEVPVVVARGWGAAQKRAYVPADNKVSWKGIITSHQARIAHIDAWLRRLAPINNDEVP